ncbi:MAG TPA: AAA family ATPase [Chloroflexota bacterium]
MSQRSQAQPTVESYDDLDRKIDEVLDTAGRLTKLILKIALAVALIVLVSTYVLVPLGWMEYIGVALWFVVQLLFAMLFLIVQFVALFWFLSRPRVYWLMPGETGVGFKDYKGNPEVLEVARRVVLLLKGVDHFKKMGGQAHRGLLLIGPPGTGKSYLGQCISSEAGCPFGYASAPSFRNMFWGVDILIVKSLYRKARNLAQKYGACILFIDEIDAIGARRSGQGPGFGMGGLFFGGGTGTLNELLTQLDPPPVDQSWRARLLRRLGLRRRPAERPNVLTIGATNIPEALDPALVRPGRFDWKITVDLPSQDGRKEIIEYYLGKVKHVPDMPVDRMAAITIGYSPVAIKHVINEAVVLAHFDGRDAITYEDFRKAMDTYEWGLKQPYKSMPMEEKRRIAYHEAGHAVAMAKLLPREELQKVTIVRHTGVPGALGFAAPRPKEEIFTRTKEELLADIQVSLASRAAEELFLGMQLSGVYGDLQQATRTATYMIALLGMNGTFYSNAAFGEFVPSERVKREVEKILDVQYRKVKAFLWEHREAVIAVAEALLEREDLAGDEVYEIIRQAEEKKRLREAPEQPALPSGDGHVAVAADGSASVPAASDGDRGGTSPER